jgi:hypothetical protein
VASLEIDALFSVRPADFVRERNALAKALKSADRREEAANVEKLPRPTLSVWVVNQLARREPALVKRLTEVTARLQSAQLRPPSGHGRVDYAAALDDHREVLKSLRARTEEILNAAELRATPEVLARIVKNLRTGIANDVLRPLIESGRLARDVGEEALASELERALAPSAASPPDDPVDRPVDRPLDRGEDGHELQHERDQAAGSGTSARAAEATRAAEVTRAAEGARAAEAARARDRAREQARREAERKVHDLRAAVAAAAQARAREGLGVEAARRVWAEAESKEEEARRALELASGDLARAEAALAALAAEP